PFTEKYIIFLFPFYFVIVSAGIFYLTSLFRFSPKKEIILTTILLVFIQTPLIVPTIKVITIDTCPYKKVVQYISKNAESKDFKIICNTFAWYGIKYYARRFGIEPKRVLKLDNLPSYHHIKNTWLVSMFASGSSDKTISNFYKKIDKYFYLDRRIPAYPAETLWSANIFRQRTDRMIFPFSPFVLKISDIKEIKNGTIEKELIVLVEGDYDITITFPLRIKKQDLRIFINDQQLQFKEEQADSLKSTIFLRYGENKFSLKEGEKNKLTEILPITVRLDKGKETICFESYLADTYTGIALPETRVRNGKSALVFERNGSALYKIPELPEGVYKFTLEAINDFPPPVLVEVKINNTSGYLDFDRGNNQWSKKTFIFDNPSTEDKTIEISFLNDINVGAGKDKINRELVLGKIQIRKIAKGSKPVVDDNIKENLRFHLPLAGINYGFESKLNSNKLSEFWRFSSNKVSYTFVNTDDGKRALKITIPYDIEGWNLVSAPISVRNTNSVYFSFWCKATKMLNHSVNALVLFLNKDMQMIRRQWLNATGLTGTTHWHQIRSLRLIPSGTAYVLFVISLYPNGKRPGKKTEYLFLCSPEFEPDTKSF
ncbi:hypothetical protein J7M23_10185, partial [Candidatus Sumerlaeota bacterium]|nr:hypothetical protein [Candidatus Sumerlaeota bacterium]